MIVKNKLLLFIRIIKIFLFHRIRPANHLIFAYHEAGHAIVMYYAEYSPHNVKMIYLEGYDIFATKGFVLPEKKKNCRHNYNEVVDCIAGLLAGRAAEKKVSEDILLGSGSDTEKATDLAMTFATSGYYGSCDLSQLKSEQSKQELDKIVKDILEQGRQRAETILSKHEDRLHWLARNIFYKKILTAGQVKKILKNPPSAQELDKWRKIKEKLQ